MVARDLRVTSISLVFLGIEISNSRRLGLLPIYGWGGTLRGDLCCFLKTPYLQDFALVVGGDVFFLLCPVEEEEGEDGVGCCAPDVQEFVCRGIAAFAMGLSRNLSFRDETRLSERIGKVLASWLVCLSSL